MHKNKFLKWNAEIRLAHIMCRIPSGGNVENKHQEFNGVEFFLVLVPLVIIVYDLFETKRVRAVAGASAYWLSFLGEYVILFTFFVILLIHTVNDARASLAARSRT